MSTASEKSSCCDQTTCCGGAHDTVRLAESSEALKDIVRENGVATQRGAASGKITCGCGTTCCSVS